MSVVALVGAQYGSEGKGAIAAKIANDFQVHVRTGGPNAGHTYYVDCKHPASAQELINDDMQGHQEYGCSLCRTTLSSYRGGDSAGRAKIVARSIPVGASNPNANLILGPGAMIDLDLLLQEYEELEDAGFQLANRLVVDHRALIIDPKRHHQVEGGVEGSAHRRIGSTGEGVGIARMAHLNRNAIVDYNWAAIEHAGDNRVKSILEDAGIAVLDTTKRMDGWLSLGANVLLEGTQGSGLSSVYGPWPYTTSADTNAGQLLVDAGISPRQLERVILVARTFPIRVAGNSGPLHLEIDWETLGVEPERTTVTKKVRRVGRWDDDLFARSVVLNGPNPAVALTFMDYVHPEDAGQEDWACLRRDSYEFISDVRDRHHVEIVMVGTGPDSIALSHDCRWGR